MKQRHAFARVGIALGAAIIVLACGGALGATATPVPTDTAVPTNTATLKPTSTPRPTATLPPTPAPMGSTVKSSNFEVNVLVAEKRARVYPGGKFYFTAAPEYMLVDVGVKVSNISGQSQSVKWNDVYIMNDNKEWWIPAFGTFKESQETLDPFAIGVSETEIDPEVEITVDSEGYFRLFYHIPKGTTYYFGFADSPLSEVVFKSN